MSHDHWIILVVTAFLMLMCYLLIKSKQERKRLSELLKNQEEWSKNDLLKLDLLLNHSSDFLFRYNTKGEIIHASQNVKRLLGYDPKIATLEYAAIQTNNPINITAKKRIRDLLKGNFDILNPYFVEVFDVNGLTHMFEVFEKPDRNVRGEIESISGVAKNITDVYRAELEIKQSEKEQGLILNALLDFMLTINSDGYILTHYTNKDSLRDLLPTIDNGQNIKDIFPLAMLKPIQEALLAANHYEHLVTFDCKANKDGKDHYFEGRLIHLTTEKFFLIIRDISATKHLEVALKEAGEAVEQGNLLKANFIATMSHEIRTPMNGIVGMTNLLQETLLNRDQRDYLETIKVSSDILLRIINDVLDFSKIESGKIEIEESVFNLKQALQESLNLITFEAKGKNIGLNLYINEDVPAFICTDRVRLRQIMMNLLSNAVKFTEKGFITVMVSVLEVSAKVIDLEFQVKDTGIGVSSSQLPSLFKHFSQGDSTLARRFQGSGLGLAIVKNLVKLLNGKVSVESKENEGSVFKFSIKAKLVRAEKMEETIKKNAEQHEEANRPLMHIISDKYPLKILLAEDNGINSKLICLVLEKMGFKPDLAKNGSIALNMLNEISYDVILMDIQMPVMDGIQATKAIKELKLEHPPKIVGLSANAFEEDIAHALSIGMDDYFVKPIQFEELKSKLIQIGQEKFPFVS